MATCTGLITAIQWVDLLVYSAMKNNQYDNINDLGKPEPEYGCWFLILTEKTITCKFCRK